MSSGSRNVVRPPPRDRARCTPAGLYGEREAGHISSSAPLRRCTYTRGRLSRATGPSNVRVVDDVHRSMSDTTCQERVPWVSRKDSNYLYADVTAFRLGADEGKQSREALGQ